MNSENDADVLLVFNTINQGQNRIFYSSELERFLNRDTWKIGHVFVDNKTIIPTPAIKKIGAQIVTSETNSVTNSSEFLLNFISKARKERWGSVGIAISSSLPISGVVEHQLSAFDVVFIFHPEISSGAEIVRA